MEGLQGGFKTSALRISKMEHTHTCQVWVLFPPTRGTGASPQWGRFDYIGWSVVWFFIVASVRIDEGVGMSCTYMVCATVLSLAP
jgi:hypothetical protein